MINNRKIIKENLSISEKRALILGLMIGYILGVLSLAGFILALPKILE